LLIEAGEHEKGEGGVAGRGGLKDRARLHGTERVRTIPAAFSRRLAAAARTKDTEAQYQSINVC
jgi:hypothetical protein